MANEDKKYLKDIVKSSQDTFKKITTGTHTTETYDELNTYEIELGEPVILGAPGSNSHINGYNELIIDASGGGNVTVNDISVVDETDETAKLSTNKALGTEFLVEIKDSEQENYEYIAGKKTYRQNIVRVHSAQQAAQWNDTKKVTDDDLRKVDLLNRAETGKYYADYAKKTILNPGEAVITVKNLDMAVVQALANHKDSLIPPVNDPATSGVEAGEEKSLKFNEDLFNTSAGANPLVVDKTGNKTKACKTLGAVRRLYVYDKIAYSSEQPMQAMEIDDNRIAKLALASTTSKKVIALNGSGADKELNPYGLIKLRKDSGLKFYKAGTIEYNGILTLDIANATDDKDTREIDFVGYDSSDNDIYERTGKRTGTAYTGEEKTKVLTSKYVDSLFKYGLGYYQGAPLQNYTLQTSKDDVKKYGNPTRAKEENPGGKDWEQVTACLTIGAVHGIAIMDRLNEGTGTIGETLIVSGNAAENTYEDPGSTNGDMIKSGRVNLNLAKPGEKSTISYDNEDKRKAAIKAFNNFDNVGLVSTTDFSGLTYGVVDYKDYYSEKEATYKRSRRDGLIAVDIPKVKTKQITTWTDTSSVSHALLESEYYYGTDLADSGKNEVEDKTGYILKTDKGEESPTGWTHDDAHTKVLTTRFIDEIVKYGLGHFNKFKRKDIDLSEDVIDINNSSVGRNGTMQILQYGEKSTACKAIGAQREVRIRSLSTVEA